MLTTQAFYLSFRFCASPCKFPLNLPNESFEVVCFWHVSPNSLRASEVCCHLSFFSRAELRRVYILAVPQLECCHILIPRLLQFVDKIASHCQILAWWMHFLQLATKFMQTPLKIYSCFPFHFQFLYFCRSFFEILSNPIMFLPFPVLFFHSFSSPFDSVRFPYCFPLFLSISFHSLFLPFNFPSCPLFSFQFPFNFLSQPLFSFQFPFIASLCLSISFHSLSLPFNFLSYPLFSSHIPFHFQSLPCNFLSYPLFSFRFPFLASFCLSISFHTRSLPFSSFPFFSLQFAFQFSFISSLFLSSVLFTSSRFL